MKKNRMMRLNREPMLNRWAAAIVAFLVVGSFSPLGMKALDLLGVKAPLADCVLSVAMSVMMLAVYQILRRNSFRRTREE